MNSGDNMSDGNKKKDRVRSTVKRSRKIYCHGDRINLNIPGYVDQSTLDWINSHAQVATKIWELIIKAAHEEEVSSNPLSILKALGLNNIETLSAVLKDANNTAESTITNSKQAPKFKKINKPKKTESQTNASHLDHIKDKSVIEEEAIGQIDEFNLPKISQHTSKIDNSSGNARLESTNCDTEVSVKNSETDKEDDGLYRKDGHMNLKAIASKSSGGRRGLSRNKGRIQLDINKPNLMEKEMFGDD